MVRKIAHQVVRTSGSRAPPKSARDPRPMHPPRRLIADLVATVRHALQGRDDPRCSGNGVRARRQAGVAPRVCGRVGNGRGMEARQGAIRVFCGDTYPAIRVPAPAPTSCRKRTRPNPHEHLMRDLANSRIARGPARSRRVSREGTVRGIAHRVKPEWWVAGRCGGRGVFEKMRMAPCRASIRLPFPASPGKYPASRHGRRVWKRAPRVVSWPWVEPRLATRSARSRVSQRGRAGAFQPRSCQGDGSPDRASREAGMVGSGGR